MNEIPDILAEILESAPAIDSNIADLQAIWKEYIDSLKVEIPEISINHDGDTVCLGELSPGCLMCKNGEWDCLFITPNCNLNCEFCISPFNADSKIPISAYGREREEILENYQLVGIKGVSFSGGEPFYNFQKTSNLFEYFKINLPDIYFWIYTNGTLVNKIHIDVLSDLGMNEIRFNTAANGYNNKELLKLIEYSAQKIENITVEIPIILSDKDMLLNCISEYENAGVKYLNLHELMKENNSNSQNLKNENFKKVIFEDGHITEISLDSKIVVNEIFSKMICTGNIMSFNFCSTMNKRRQVKKRRQNMIKLLKQPHEKIVDEEYLETVFLYKGKNDYKFLHPDEWFSNKIKNGEFNSFALRKLAPLSIYNDGRYVHAQKI